MGRQQLGSGQGIAIFTATDRVVFVPSPEAVAGMAGGRQSTIAVTVTGAVYTWGDGRDGQLGDGSTTSSGRIAPGMVPGLTADAVAMGRDFAFAIVPA